MRNSKILAANLKVLQPNISLKSKSLALTLVILAIVILVLGLGLTSTKQVIGVYNCQSYTNVETAIAEVSLSGYNSEKASAVDETILPGVYLVTINQSPIEKTLGRHRIGFQKPSEEFEELVKEVFDKKTTSGSGSSFIPFKQPA